jgi:hypothetical protein
MDNKLTPKQRRERRMRIAKRIMELTGLDYSKVQFSMIFGPEGMPENTPEQREAKKIVAEYWKEAMEETERELQEIEYQQIMLAHKIINGHPSSRDIKKGLDWRLLDWEGDGDIVRYYTVPSQMCVDLARRINEVPEGFPAWDDGKTFMYIVVGGKEEMYVCRDKEGLPPEEKRLDYLVYECECLGDIGEKAMASRGLKEIFASEDVAVEHVENYHYRLFDKATRAEDDTVLWLKNGEVVFTARPVEVR